MYKRQVPHIGAVDLVQDNQVLLGGTYSDIRTDGSVTQMNLVFLNQIDCTDVWDLTLSLIHIYPEGCEQEL